MKKYKAYAAAFIAATFFAIASWNGVFGKLNLTASDILYQKPRSVERQIVILGIDDEALEYFGPIQTWSREIYADAVYLLNESKEARPAVIGLDVIFGGQTEEETDAYFAEAAGEYGNVVVGTMVEFGTSLLQDTNGNSILDEYAVLEYTEPYDELKAVTGQGFLNNMFDVDGVVRSGILHVDLPDGRRADSFSFALYKQYAAKHGLDIQRTEQMPLMNSRYHWYVPFSGNAGNIEHYSLADLFEGEIRGADMKDCIVLIGAYAEGLQDSFVTAVDHAEKMHGVEIHGNMIQAMLRGEYKQYVSGTLQAAFLWLLIFGCIVFFSKCKMYAATLCWALLGVGYIPFAMFCYQNGYILDILYVPVSLTVVYMVQVVSKYVLERMEKRKVVHTFKRYMAPQVVEELFKVDSTVLGLGGKEVEIACLFVDIRGFTTMSEVLSPTEVVEILNSYLELTSRCIFQNEGTLDKFIGDATMAIFNAPLPLEDYVYKAVKTGMDMVEASHALEKALEEKYGRKVSFGVGVNVGKAVVGNIGTKDRMDYTAIGDTVNTAARLEANAKAGQVLISKDVYDRLGDRIEVKSLGNSIKLKGKSNEFEIFEVTAIR